MDDQFSPYCFILDDTYRVLMAGPCDAAEAAAASTATAPVGSLPAPLDRAVRALTASWKAEAGSNAKINGLHLTIAPVPGSDGGRIAVFVRRSLTAYA